MQTLDYFSYAILNIERTVLFLQIQATFKIRMQSQNIISIMIAVGKNLLFLQIWFYHPENPHQDKTNGKL